MGRVVLAVFATSYDRQVKNILTDHVGLVAEMECKQFGIDLLAPQVCDFHDTAMSITL